MSTITITDYDYSYKRFIPALDVLFNTLTESYVKGDYSDWNMVEEIMHASYGGLLSRSPNGDPYISEFGMHMLDDRYIKKLSDFIDDHEGRERTYKF